MYCDQMENRKRIDYLEYNLQISKRYKIHALGLNLEFTRRKMLRIGAKPAEETLPIAKEIAEAANRLPPWEAGRIPDGLYSFSIIEIRRANDGSIYSSKPPFTSIEWCQPEKLKECSESIVRDIYKGWLRSGATKP